MNALPIVMITVCSAVFHVCSFNLQQVRRMLLLQLDMWRVWPPLWSNMAAELQGTYCWRASGGGSQGTQVHTFFNGFTYSSNILRRVSWDKWGKWAEATLPAEPTCDSVYHPPQLSALWFPDSLGCRCCSYKNYFKSHQWVSCNPPSLGCSCPGNTIFIKAIHALRCVDVRSGSSEGSFCLCGRGVKELCLWWLQFRHKNICWAENTSCRPWCWLEMKKIGVHRSPARDFGKIKYCYPHWHLTFMERLNKILLLKIPSFHLL